MINKYYEVSCDHCLCVINFYHFKPSYTALRKDGCKIKIINGKHYIYCCEECYTKAIHANN